MVLLVPDDNMARMGPKGGPVYSHSEWTESSLHKIQVKNGSDFWRNNQIRQTAIHHCHLDDISLSNDNHHKITGNNQDQKNEKNYEDDQESDCSRLAAEQVRGEVGLLIEERVNR